MSATASSTDFRLAWRNLGRNRKRTILAWSGIAIAQMILVWMSSFINGYEELIFQKLTGPTLGHIQVHAPRYRDDGAIERTIPGASEVIRKIQDTPGVTGVSARIYAPVLATREVLGHVAQVTGLDFAVESRAGGLLEGLPAEMFPGPGEALIGRALGEEMGVHPGDQLALMGQGVDGSVASGLYRIKRLVPCDVEQIDRAGILMSLPVARELLAMGDEVHELTVHVDRPADIPAVTTAIRGRFSGPKGLEVLSWNELVPQIATMLEMVSSLNWVILVLVFLTTAAGVANTMLMATFERSHELGMLLALGCRPSRLIRMLCVESAVLGLSGVFIGSAVAVAIVWHEMRTGLRLPGISGAAGISFTMEGVNLGTQMVPILKAGDVLRGVVGVLVTSIVASIWPARRISRLEPVEAMRS